VRLNDDASHLRREFDTIDYQYSEAMLSMAGELEVLCLARENRGATMVGLPSPDGSQDGVWYFPSSVLEAVDSGDGVGHEESASETGVARARDYRWDLTQQGETAPRHELGDITEHQKYGYRGVIVGYDTRCEQPEAWIETMSVDELPRGREQVFYHVLVDTRDRPGDQVTYVAEDNIRRPERGVPGPPVRHRLVETMLLPHTFDDERHRYEPSPALLVLYPAGVEGCWMVDGVVPDASSA